MTDRSDLLPRGFREDLPPNLERFHPDVRLRHVLQFFRTLELRWDDDTRRAGMLRDLRELAGRARREGLEGLQDVADLVEALGPEPDRDRFVVLLAPLERRVLRDLTDTDLLVRSEDRIPASTAAARMPVRVVLDNLRSAFNVGSVFRTADCVGVEEVVLTGYTPTPAHDGLARAAMGATEWVPWSRAGSAFEAFDRARADGLLVIGVETVEGATDLWSAPPPRPSAFVFGNERYGLEPGKLAACDEVLSIPVFGVKNSLNVAVATALVLYEVRRRFEQR